MTRKDEKELENAESIDENICAKKIACYGYDTDQWRRIAVDADGKIKIAI